jgi:hypothetical protein
MSNSKKSYAIILLGIYTAIIFPDAQTYAQSKFCSSDGTYEPPSATFRNVNLHEFGIKVEIPNNYKAMKRSNNSVQILHPDDFEMFQCIAKGGRGGGGYYSQTIKTVNRDSSKTLRDQAKWSAGYSIDQQGNRTPTANQILEYRKYPLSGYIVTSELGYGVIFLGKVQGKKEILEVSVGCDCPVKINDLTSLLSRIKPL